MKKLPQVDLSEIHLPRKLLVIIGPSLICFLANQDKVRSANRVPAEQHRIKSASKKRLPDGVAVFSLLGAAPSWRSFSIDRCAVEWAAIVEGFAGDGFYSEPAGEGELGLGSLVC